MSFESLVKKLMKEGKSKTAATKIAGSVANAKMKGAGSGPTAKQKARAKSPATKKRKPRAVIRDKDRVADKSRSYTDKKGRKIEIKTFKAQKKYDSGVKDDPSKPSMRRKSSRLANTVELHKTKTKKDGTTKTKVKRAAGGGKKSQRLHTKFAKGKNKEGSSDVIVNRKSPTTMKKQMTDPKKTGEKKAKSMKTSVDKKIKKGAKELRPPRDSGASKKYGAPTKMKSPAKKPLVGKQKSLPKELQQAILKSPGKMLTKSGIKMMDKSPMNMKKSKQKVEQDYARNAIADYKSGKKKEAKYEKKKALEVAAGESPAKMKKPITKKKYTTDTGTKAKVKLKKGKPGESSQVKVKLKTAGGTKRKFVMNTSKKSLSAPGKGETVNDPQKYKSRRDAKKADPLKKKSPAKMKKPSKKRAKLMDKVEKFDNLSNFRGRPGNLKPRKNEGSEKRYDKRMDRGFDKADKKMSKVMAIDSAAKMKKSPGVMKTNQSGGGYAAKNPAAPARQLKKLGSVLSKHFKSNR